MKKGGVEKGRDCERERIREEKSRVTRRSGAIP